MKWSLSHTSLLSRNGKQEKSGPKIALTVYVKPTWLRYNHMGKEFRDRMPLPKGVLWEGLGEVMVLSQGCLEH
jgi:hypothetical protein